jgi:hypothetical protein
MSFFIIKENKIRIANIRGIQKDPVLLRPFKVFLLIQSE